MCFASLRLDEEVSAYGPKGWEINARRMRAKGPRSSGFAGIRDGIP